MACEQRPERDAEAKEILGKSIGDRWEAGVDALLAKAGKKIGTFANRMDKDRKLLKYISTSDDVLKASRMMNDMRNDNVNLARGASDLFEFIHKEVTKEDGVLLTRTLGGDMKFGDLPPHLDGIYTTIRNKIDEAANNLVEMGALSEKSKMENYLKRYYTKYLEEKSSSASLRSKVFKRKNLTLKQRVDLGMVEDAGFVIANTLLEQQRQLHRYRLLKQLSDTFAVDEKLDGYTRVDDGTFDTGVNKWGALAGKYIPDDVMLELKMSADVADAVSFLDKSFITNAVDHIKVNVTVKNFGTHAYNVGSNLQLAALNGDLGALADIGKMSKVERKKLWELGKSLGLENELAEYEKLHTKINEDLVREPGKKNWYKTFAKNLYMAEGTLLGDKTRALYQLEDEVFKMASFHKRIKKLDNPTPEQYKHAMREAMADYVDYSTPLPPLIKRLDKNGLFPFSHYVWKSTPRVGMIMLKNPLKVVALQAALYAANGGIFNDNDDNAVKSKWGKEEGLFGMFKYLPTNLFMAKQWVNIGDDAFLNIGRSLPGARLGGLSVDLGFVGATVSLIQGRDPLFKQKLYKDEDGTATAIVKTLHKTSINYLPPMLLGRYAQQWAAIALGMAPKNHYGEDLSFKESIQRLLGVRKFNGKKEIVNSAKGVIKLWKYDNIDTQEMKSRIAVIKAYAKEHDVDVDNKKINNALKAAKKEKPKIAKDFYYYLNRYMP